VRLGDCGRDGRPLLGLTLTLDGSLEFVSTMACRAGGAGLDVSLTGSDSTEEEDLDGVLWMEFVFLSLSPPDLTLSGLSCVLELNPFLDSSLESNLRSP